MNSNYLIAIRAAVEAGKKILEIYQESGLKIEYKQDNSPLTIADKAAHGIIAKALESTKLPVLSEEGKHMPFPERRLWDQFWLVDPLDGTKEFIKQNGEFTVNIALIHEGKSIFGVVYAPVLKALHIGMVGEGAYLCSDPQLFDEPLDVLIKGSIPLPATEGEEACFKVVASRSHYNEKTEAFVKTLENNSREVKLVSKGSSLKLCMVASGEADVYPRLGPTMEWDTAAAHAVVKASGKNVYRIDSDKDTGMELEYNKENLLNPFFVVR